MGGQNVLLLAGSRTDWRWGVPVLFLANLSLEKERRFLFQLFKKERCQRLSISTGEVSVISIHQDVSDKKGHQSSGQNMYDMSMGMRLLGNPGAAKENSSA